MLRTRRRSFGNNPAPFSAMRDLLERRLHQLNTGGASDMRISSGLTVAAAASMAISISVAASASAAQMNTKVGYLSCQVSKGWGIVFGSSRDLECTYTPLKGNG